MKLLARLPAILGMNSVPVAGFVFAGWSAGCSERAEEVVP